MPDLIVGIAVLNNRLPIHQLYFYRQTDGKTKCSDQIPVYPKGSPKPCDPAWEYEAANGVLTCRPSVWVRYQREEDPEPRQWHTLFHNDGVWSVKYKEGTADDLRPFNEPP